MPSPLKDVNRPSERAGKLLEDLRRLEEWIRSAVAELSAKAGPAAQELAELIERGRELAATFRGELEQLTRQLQDARDASQRERVVEAMLPPEVPSPASVWHAQHSAEARLALVREFGAWSAAEVADRVGSTAANRAALASAWRSAGRALAVEWKSRTVYPTFQFTADGQPRAVMAPVLADLRRAGLSDWQSALWFATPTGWLDDRRPVDLLDTDPAAIETAAGQFDQRPT